MRLSPSKVAFGLVLSATAWASAPDVGATRHNLSVSGPGEVRAQRETEICIFCHAAHIQGDEDMLWNHKTNPNVTYLPYQSPTLAARTGQPSGSSVKCLSCHDGTIAVGAVGTRPNPIQMLGVDPLGRLARDSGSNLGTDLSGSHPISISYAEAVKGRNAQDYTTRLLENPSETDGPLLDSTGSVQCMSCHDPHIDPASQGLDVPPFWRTGSFSETCEACHVAPTQEYAHDSRSLLRDGCGSCHVGHGVSQQPLLPAGEELACLSCHGYQKDILKQKDAGLITEQADPASIAPLFALPHRHPVDETYGVHQADEDLLAEGADVERHVECADCHPSHGEPSIRTSSGIPTAGTLRPGLSAGRQDYELCYECHSENTNLPFGSTDKSLEFDPVNASYHPVEAPVVAGRTPSLRSPWREGLTMTCMDCHGPDQSTAPEGPHGSRNPFILKGNYTVTDGEPESPYVYEACYSCHSRSSILSNESFAGHNEHVVSGAVSCYTCHDSHGSPDNGALIRFNKNPAFGMVMPSSSGTQKYQEDVGGQTCWVNCHGVDHNPLSYP